MAIINKKTNRIVAKDHKICKSAFSKALGLMFSRKKTLIFIFSKEKTISLQMFFVFFPIDVLFLDKNKKVVEIKKNFKPFTFYTSRKKAKYIIEVPERTTARIGDIIRW